MFCCTPRILCDEYLSITHLSTEGYCRQMEQHKSFNKNVLLFLIMTTMFLPFQLYQSPREVLISGSVLLDGTRERAGVPRGVRMAEYNLSLVPSLSFLSDHQEIKCALSPSICIVCLRMMHKRREDRSFTFLWFLGWKNRKSLPLHEYLSKIGTSKVFANFQDRFKRLILICSIGLFFLTILAQNCHQPTPPFFSFPFFLIVSLECDSRVHPRKNHSCC